MKKLLLLVLLIGSGCGPMIKAQRHKMLDSWVGYGKDALVKAWGIPTREYTMTDGTLLMEYNQTSTRTTQNASFGIPVTNVPMPFIQTIGGGSSTDQVGCVYTFSVIKDRIHRWAYDCK
jgi:hypothetical protein